MFDLFRKRLEKTGAPPGTLQYVGDPRGFRAGVEIVTYGPDHFQRRAVSPEELGALTPDAGSTIWVRVTGIHDPAMVRAVGEALGMHGLLQEDVLDSTQRTKVDMIGDLLFLVMRSVVPDDDPRSITTEQVSLAVRGNLLATFQETERNPWDGVLKRIEAGRERLRSGGGEALFIALLDAQVDGLQEELSLLSEQVRELDQNILDNPSERLVRDIYEAKRRNVFLADLARPFRDMATQILRERNEQLSESGRIHLRDVLDHAIQAAEAVIFLGHLAESMFATCISLNGLRMNQAMKVLTVIATVFIPLTFIAGVYGMNFRNIPELGWRFGYFYSLGLMAVVALVMVIFFIRRKWL